MFRSLSMRQLAQRHAARVRAKLKQEERFRKQVQRDYEKKMKALERERAKEERERQRKIREEKKKLEAAEKQVRLEARIEARLRKQFRIPKDAKPLVLEGEYNRTLEIASVAQE